MHAETKLGMFLSTLTAYDIGMQTKLTKSNLVFNISRAILPNRATSSRAYLRGLAPRQHSCETSQRRRAVGGTVSDLTGPGIELQTSQPNSQMPQK